MAVLSFCAATGLFGIVAGDQADDTKRRTRKKCGNNGKGKESTHENQYPSIPRGLGAL